MILHRHTLLLCCACLGLALQPADAGDVLAGPVEARVVRIIDGDTIEADALVWPGHRVRVAVRIRGIDAPELRSRCPEEKAAAQAARDALSLAVGTGDLVLTNIGADKYFGRVVADVATSEGDDIAGRLMSLSMVVAYDGRTRVPFCIDG